MAHHRVTMEIVLPDPCLVVLVGAAGAGKSTFAARHFAPDEVLSSDRYRAIVSGDASNQAATRQAFGRLHRDLSSRLSKGLLTVVDATNVEAWARRALVTRAAAAGVPSIAIVLDLPPTTVLGRNAARRERVVDEAVVHRHLDAVTQTRAALETAGSREGFADVIVLREPAAVDGVRIVRRRPA